MDERILAISNGVLQFARNNLVVKLRFMDMAIHSLTPIPNEDAETVCTDGRYIYYSPRYILKVYKDCANMPTRQYLHMILHCVFRHFFVNTLVDRQKWDLACDIAIESIALELNLDCIALDDDNIRINEINKLKSHVKHISAEYIYRYFLDNEAELDKLEALFKFDDHSIWYERGKSQSGENGQNGDNENSDEQDKDNRRSDENEQSDNDNNSGGQNKNDTQTEENEQNNNNSHSGGQSKNNTKSNKHGQRSNNSYGNGGSSRLEQQWRDISEKMQLDLESFSKERGNESGSLVQNLKDVNREKYDYTDFLKKFAVYGEAMKINDDEYDNIFYTYGLKLYKKMPLIEPLEYKEVKRIKEFAIAIDTSGSVSGDLVQKFVQKTYNILKQTESFFTKINLHIIQCDTQIQEDIKITCQEEFDNYIKDMTVKGLGGTDFRPVFDYVDELIKNKEFINLRGLIYFTDGYGVFPNYQPEYKTAFIYIDDDYNNYDVPIWAIKLILRSDEI